MITIQGTKQELFDACMSHAAQQKCRAGRVNDYDECTCRYRADDNKKCFIGVFITDEDYSFELENNSIRTLLGKKVICAESVSVQFLVDLQDIHDLSSTIDGFKHRASEFADKYNLNGELIDTVEEWR